MTGPQACPGHTATVMDWGLGELGRREGAEKALQKMEELANLNRYDLHLYVGNLKSRQHIFGIVGLWYPLAADVHRNPLELNLFDQPPTEEPPRILDGGGQIEIL